MIRVQIALDRRETDEADRLLPWAEPTIPSLREFAAPKLSAGGRLERPLGSSGSPTPPFLAIMKPFSASGSHSKSLVTRRKPRRFAKQPATSIDSIRCSSAVERPGARQDLTFDTPVRNAVRRFAPRCRSPCMVSGGPRHQSARPRVAAGPVSPERSSRSLPSNNLSRSQTRESLSLCTLT